MIIVDDPIETFLSSRPVSTIVFIVIAFILGVLVTWVLLRMIGRYFLEASDDRDLPATLVLTLSLITLILVIGGLITKDESAWTLAATGIGALAASLTSYFTRTKDPLPTVTKPVEPADPMWDVDDDEDEDEPEEDESIGFEEPDEEPDYLAEIAAQENPAQTEDSSGTKDGTGQPYTEDR